MGALQTHDMYPPTKFEDVVREAAKSAAELQRFIASVHLEDGSQSAGDTKKLAKWSHRVQREIAELTFQINEHNHMMLKISANKNMPSLKRSAKVKSTHAEFGFGMNEMSDE